MQQTILVGVLAAAGAFAGMIFTGSRPEAAEEIRCRVNAEAFLNDLSALHGKRQSSGSHSPDRDALEKILGTKP